MQTRPVWKPTNKQTLDDIMPTTENSNWPCVMEMKWLPKCLMHSTYSWIPHKIIEWRMMNYSSSNSQRNGEKRLPQKACNGAGTEEIRFLICLNHSTSHIWRQPQHEKWSPSSRKLEICLGHKMLTLKILELYGHLGIIEYNFYFISEETKARRLTFLRLLW